jgi:HEPN domain-containing protein
LAEGRTSQATSARRAANWLGQSAHDLSDARFAAEGGRHALACFLGHQSAEKAIAGYLYARGAEAVWSHSLADLCEDAMSLDASFDLIKTVAVLLDKHYLGARYPSALPGGVPAEAHDAQDSQRALEVAEDVREFVLARIGQK